MLLIHQMDGYSSKTYFHYQEDSEEDSDEDEEDPLKKTTSIKYTVLKEEDFIDEEE